MEKRGSFLTREAILRAADWVVVEEGVSGMTLEAVAREAGVSKGGLLYHFPCKEALIGGMTGRLTTLLNPLRRSFQDGQRWAERDGIDPAVATLVRLAADGLFFVELLGFAPAEGALRKRVLGALLSLTEKPSR